MKLTLVPSGEFLMGSGESAEETAAFFNKTYDGDLDLSRKHFSDGVEHPQHRVRITKPFYLGTYHVTISAVCSRHGVQNGRGEERAAGDLGLDS
jgi:formylglycine-generating enzyme required for sulfatase activity